MLLGIERLVLLLRQSQAVQMDITQCSSIPVSIAVSYPNAALRVLGNSTQIPPECPFAISTGQRLSYSSV